MSEDSGSTLDLLKSTEDNRKGYNSTETTVNQSLGMDRSGSSCSLGSCPVLSDKDLEAMRHRRSPPSRDVIAEQDALLERRSNLTLIGLTAVFLLWLFIYPALLSNNVI